MENDNRKKGPIVVWEITRECSLHCRGCPTLDDGKTKALSTYEAYKVVDQISSIDPREFVITGGDPLERDDVFQVIDYARRRGLEPALAVMPTTHLTLEAIGRLQRNGLTKLIFSVDGSSPAVHDLIHCVPGSFGATIRAMRWAGCVNMAIEVNTLVTRRNLADLAVIAELIRPFSIQRWNVHFLVPFGPSNLLEAISAEEVEGAFAFLSTVSVPYLIRTVEAPQYRRYLAQRALAARLQSVEREWADFAGYEQQPTGEDKIREAAVTSDGYLFVSHAGDVRVSEFLPLSAGNLRYHPLQPIYGYSDLFTVLRDAANLKGKCGICEFRRMCGGSRARAWAMTGDLFASDPLCAYQPPAFHLGASATTTN